MKKYLKTISVICILLLVIQYDDAINFNRFVHASVQVSLLQNNLDFSGSNYLNLGESVNLKPADNLTISMWINPSSTQNEYADIISCHSSELGGYTLEQSGTSSNVYLFAYWNGTGWQRTDPVQLVANVWQHVVLEKCGSTLKFIVDGQVESSKSCIGNIQYYNNGSVYLGTWSRYVGSRCFNGSLDDVCIWNKTLSDAEIQNIKNNGASSVNEGIINLLNTNSHSPVTSEVVPKPNIYQNLDFTGSNYLNLGTGVNLKPADNLTISMWINPSSTQNEYADIISCHNNELGGYTLEQNGTSSNEYLFAYWNGNGWQRTDPVRLVADVWQHVVLEKSGSTLKFIVDEQLKSCKSCIGNIQYYNNGSVYLGTWSRYVGSRCFNGSLDDVCIWNKTLNDAEIQTVRNSGASSVNGRVMSALQNTNTKHFIAIYSDARFIVNVMDSNTLQPISGATVKVGDTTIVTNDKGVAEFKNINPETADIYITKEGYDESSYEKYNVTDNNGCYFTFLDQTEQ